VLDNGQSWTMSSDGYFLQYATASSQDGAVTVSIPYLTQALGPDGLPVTQITVNSVDPPPAPEGMHILAAFSFQPSGATFSPGIQITITFDPSEVAEGETVAIAFFNEATQAWDFVEGTISGGTAVFDMSHFTIFVVMAGQQQPASTTTPGPATTGVPDASPSNVSGGLSAGSWAGIAVGIILVILIAVLFFMRWRRSAPY